MKKIGKKANLDNLAGLVTSLVFVAVLLAVGFLILANIKTQVISEDACDNTNDVYNSTSKLCFQGVNQSQRGNGTSYSYNGTATTTNAMAGVPQWLSVIVIVVIGAVILGLIRVFRR